MTRFILPVLAVFLVPLLVCAGDDSGSGLYGNGLGNFWQGFRKYWIQTFTSVNGVVLVAVSLGALGIFIITRGKWIK